MIFLNFTAELDEPWDQDTGTVQWVVVKLNNIEVSRFRPSSYMHVEGLDTELAYEMVRWLKLGSKHG